MSDDTETFKFDIDNEAFVEKANQAIELIGQMGSGEALAGLTAALGSVAIAAGIVGTAFIALKVALDLVGEGEQIRMINDQFDMLAKNAGVAGDELKAGLEKSAAGLVDNDELIKAANKSLVTMGATAAQLPQILDLARKATQTFGGDLLSNFEKINQAIATGQTRGLRSVGIIVNQKQAYEDYAKSIGISVEALSQQGKQQAMLNEVLAIGTKSFNGTNTEIMTTSKIITQMNVAIKEMGEAISVAFEKVAGPAVRSFLSSMKDVAVFFKDRTLMAFGDDAQQATAKIEILEKGVETMRTRIDDMNKAAASYKDASFFGKFFGTTPEKAAEETTRMNGLIDQNLAKIASLKKQLGGAASASGASGAGASGGISANQATDQEAQKKLTIKFEAEMLKIKSDRINAEKELINSLEQVQTQLQDERLQKEKAFQNQLQQIANSKELNQQQKDQLSIEAKKTHDADILELEKKQIDERIKLYETYQKNATSAQNGVLRAFQVNTLKSEKDMKDFGKQGQMVYDAFSSHAIDALDALGQGTESATDVMKGFFFGMLGDMASNYGKVMLLASLWPPNPVGLVGGAALIALGGFLHGMAGGKGASASSSDSGGAVSTGYGSSGGDTSSAASSSSAVTSDPAAFQATKRAVTVQIQGNYFETEQTKTRLLEMIRENTDATDFKYVQVGQ